MPKRMNDPKVKPIEEWGAEEWEAAFNKKNADYEQLKKQMKGIFIYLHRAIGKIQEIIN